MFLVCLPISTWPDTDQLELLVSRDSGTIAAGFQWLGTLHTEYQMPL